ncbi:MAG: Rieske 2Fe-2S domain-containing protein, partial [Acidobacteriota bacterium]
MNKVRIAEWDDLEDRQPAAALVSNVDLVLVRYDDRVSVLYGRCLHRGALMADGTIRDDDIVCGVHGWDYQYRSGISAYNSSEVLHKFSSWIEDGGVWVDEDEIAAWERENPQAYDRDAYQG